MLAGDWFAGRLPCAALRANDPRAGKRPGADSRTCANLRKTEYPAWSVRYTDIHTNTDRAASQECTGHEGPGGCARTASLAGNAAVFDARSGCHRLRTRAIRAVRADRLYAGRGMQPGAYL